MKTLFLRGLFFHISNREEAEEAFSLELNEHKLHLIKSSFDGATFTQYAIGRGNRAIEERLEKNFKKWEFCVDWNEHTRFVEQMKRIIEERGLKVVLIVV